MSSIDYSIEEHTSDMFKVKVFIGEDLIYFNVHFEKFKLLPAIAQIKIITDISKDIFHKELVVNKLLKLKFTDMILPNTNIFIECHLSDNIISFKIYDDNKKYSDGKVYFS
ncbi:3-hydroxyacyl-ACP dehydratase [Brachyspira hyodysenteriae]|uniref:3-hydroxyacyl-ACP dehydratase n=1 Tax=Brachyspira hyodysenteriae TaxID=159 RepID=UPI001183B3DA|nr:3-hydroxyacyl-ACP dehydratase [Brachyspira hyodysenteriae]TVL64071.1 3-hydroxyacyl-ACP dehydratase [Brachyspira hyodysenteriae]TVL77327.1 3-hydroxyacyl-ACP dehydratase [Brachyspira hyodysenteriae]